MFRVLNPSPTDQPDGFADLAMGEGQGERANGKASSIRARCAGAPSPAFGTLSHKWERGKT